MFGLWRNSLLKEKVICSGRECHVHCTLYMEDFCAKGIFFVWGRICCVQGGSFVLKEVILCSGRNYCVQGGSFRAGRDARTFLIPKRCRTFKKNLVMGNSLVSISLDCLCWAGLTPWSVSLLNHRNIKKNLLL